MSAVTALWVALAGAIGSVLRWAIATSMPRTARMPWATLGVNVVGAFAIGAIVSALGTRGLADTRLRTVLTTGLLGGFTTYSAFALETVELADAGRLESAAIYVVVTLIAGLGACALGLAIGRAV
jgi:CrcB protein